MVQGIVNALTDVRLRGGGAKVFPAAFGGHPEDTGSGVLIAIFQGTLDSVFVVAEAGVGAAEFLFQLILALPKGIGDELQKDQTEDNVLVLLRFGKVGFFGVLPISEA